MFFFYTFPLDGRTLSVISTVNKSCDFAPRCCLPIPPLITLKLNIKWCTWHTWVGLLMTKCNLYFWDIKDTNLLVVMMLLHWCRYSQTLVKDHLALKTTFSAARSAFQLVYPRLQPLLPQYKDHLTIGPSPKLVFIISRFDLNYLWKSRQESKH